MEPALPWDGMTIEESLRKAFAERREHELIAVIRNLPTELKLKYREVWKKLILEREMSQNESARDPIPPGV